MIDRLLMANDLVDSLVSKLDIVLDRNGVLDFLKNCQSHELQ